MFFGVVHPAKRDERLARRAGPYEIEVGQVEWRVERVGLDEQVAAIAGLKFYVHAGYMEPRLLEPFCGPARAAEKIESPQHASPAARSASVRRVGMNA